MAEAIEAANALVTGKLTVDMHSHGGGFIREDSTPDAVADSMRTGGMAVASLESFPTRRRIKGWKPSCAGFIGMNGRGILMPARFER
jgi:hypothetical protein